MRYAAFFAALLLLAGCAGTHTPPVGVTPPSPSPLPLAPYSQENKVVDKVFTESYINNHRVMFICSGVEEVSVLADASGMTVVFPFGTRFKPPAAYTAESLDAPCRYAGLTESEGLALRFICRPDTLIYPEFSGGTLDLILTPGTR